MDGNLFASSLPLMARSARDIQGGAFSRGLRAKSSELGFPFGAVIAPCTATNLMTLARRCQGGLRVEHDDRSSGRCAYVMVRAGGVPSRERKRNDARAARSLRPWKCKHECHANRSARAYERLEEEEKSALLWRYFTACCCDKTNANHPSPKVWIGGE